MNVETPRERFLRLLFEELDFAYAKHGMDPWGEHEFYAITLEEFEEMWQAIKSDAPRQEVLKELIQVAAMCLRYFETGDRYQGFHPVLESWRPRLEVP